jgi:ABC-type uncharacterized transport system ATPase subunit
VTTAIHTAGLTKRYRDTLALDNLSPTVPQSEAYGYLGPNGAGGVTFDGPAPSLDGLAGVNQTTTAGSSSRCAGTPAAL